VAKTTHEPNKDLFKWDKLMRNHDKLFSQLCAILERQRKQAMKLQRKLTSQKSTNWMDQAESDLKSLDEF
jgi:hypothetical protein